MNTIRPPGRRSERRLVSRQNLQIGAGLVLVLLVTLLLLIGPGAEPAGALQWMTDPASAPQLVPVATV